MRNSDSEQEFRLLGVKRRLLKLSAEGLVCSYRSLALGHEEDA
jgi:hypothetical protein